MKQYIEERVMEVAHYILNTKSTVREAAKRFSISKSTVHKVYAIGNGILTLCLDLARQHKIEVLKALCVPSIIGGGAQ